jgi:hypothetical protein
MDSDRDLPKGAQAGIGTVIVALLSMLLFYCCGFGARCLENNRL